MADCLNLILAGNVITGITCTWTNVISYWFYMILIIDLGILIFMRTDSVYSAISIVVLLSSLMVPILPPVAQFYLLITLSVIIASIIYMALIRD